MTHFEQLEELVNDEDKIVTVPYFALLKKISTEESQKAVNQLLEVNKELHKTYILTGIRKSTGAHSIVIVNEETLAIEKEQFKNNPQQTVFSVQKGKNIDYNVVFQASLNIGSQKDSIPGSIVGKNCTKRKLIKSVLPVSSNNAPKASKPSIFPKDSLATKTLPLPEECKEESEKPVKNESKKSNNIANMFSKAVQKKKAEPKNVSTSQKPKQQGSGLHNFFTKQSPKEIKNEVTNTTKVHSESVTNGSDTDEQIMNDLRMQIDSPVIIEVKNDSDSANSPPNKKQKTSNLNTNKKSDLFDSDTDEEIMKDLEIQQHVETKKVTKSTEKKTKKNQTTQKRNKRETSRNKKEMPDKKRKRIVVAEDSESDIFQSDEDNNDILEDLEQPETESAEDVKPPPVKSKRRKIVKRTYEDEEGFIVTQPEEVYETASEDENMPSNKISKKEIPKPEPKPEPKPKLEKKDSSEIDASPNKGGKNKKGAKKPDTNQPTLMSFFKKK